MATNPGDECQGKDEMEIDEPPFIVKVGAKNQLNLDADVLHQVISRFEPPLVVLSVIGRPRSGKSFLFNYILRYLKANGDGKWFGKPDEPLDGFPWNQGDDDEDREGIRVYHENVCIGEEQETSLRLILLDIDFFVKPSCQDSALRYAALEAFCLAVSNVVLYVDSSFKAQVDIEAYLKQILAKVFVTPQAQVKYILYETAQEHDEPHGHDTAVPSALLRLNTTTLPAYRYAAVKFLAFKGEHKFLSANSNLKNFKSLLINTFPVNELQELLSTPDAHYQSVKLFLEKSKSTLDEINGAISSIPIHKYPLEVQGRVLSILAGEEENGQAMQPASVENSLPVKRFTTVECIAASAEAKKEVVDGNGFQSKLQSTDPGSVKLKDLNEASTSFSTPTSVRNIPYSTEINLYSGAPKDNPVSVNLQSHSSPQPRAQDWIQHHFKEEFQKCLQSNLGYFVRDSTTRATLWSTITDYIVKNLTRSFNDCNHIETNKMAQIHAQELLQFWKPVITGFNYFQSMVENEFDSELFLNHATLKSLFEKAESFATRKFNAGGNKVLNWMFKECVEACKKNYLKKNKLVQESELKIMQGAVAEAVKHFKFDLNLQLPSDSNISLKELQEIRKLLFVNCTAALNKCYAERQEYLLPLQSLIDTEFNEIIRLREKTLRMADEHYREIVETRLTSYEEQMRVPFENNLPLEKLIASHEGFKGSAIDAFRRSITTDDELAETYKSDLITKIQASFDTRLKQIQVETGSTKAQNTPAKRLNDHHILQCSNIDNRCTIGIHLGRSKTRCSSYSNGKFFQIPLEGDSSVLPSYLGVRTEGNLVIGSDAELLNRYYRGRALRIGDLEIGNYYRIPDNGNVNYLPVSFELVVALFLKFICRKSEEFLKSNIELVVVTVPSLSDHTFRRAITDAAQISGIENVHLLSESSSAVVRYIQKYSSDLGQAKDIMVAYQGKKSFTETAYFKVGQQYAKQMACSEIYLERQPAWYELLWAVITMRYFNKSETYATASYKQLKKSTKNVETLLLATDLPNSDICKPKDNPKYTEDIDLAAGIVEGACYYAQSLTSNSSILIQECIPYDLYYEYQEETFLAFKKFTPLPEEAVLRLTPNLNDSQIQLKLYTRFSNDEVSTTHTHTLSIVTRNISPYDTVEFKLELDTQGLLSISAFLFDSKSRNRKSVMANIMHTTNLDIIKLKESKDKLDGLYTFLVGTEKYL